jgi:hypothetical protein
MCGTCVYTILIKKRFWVGGRGEANDLLEDLDIDCSKTLKWILQD